nr:cytochrome O ubiquinol oxidase subunit III [Salmonella sp. NCTC 7297]
MATDTLTHATAHAHEHGHHDAGQNKIFGFWVYLMSDCILFSILFATYAVLVNGTAGGPTGKDIFELPFVLVETFLLLFSSITYGMAAIAMHKNNKSQVISWLALTFLFGAGFIGMEIYEFHHLIVNGMGPGSQRLPVCVLRAGRHARSARHFRSYLDGGADGASRPSRSDQH